ncbi:hypothetical protein EG68_10889 [Paragonimus skrjabini miyazakii]|uniref:G-protein coupled receptors family 1 profile domain-containing protein n=1 Tax=Paragonimus skrjabini miyazakii TaxID=59628 RepID=A0A8S9YKX6_9TREM|nr:hypothetical protein EG68_10889 [Paragonimus skrjabini miyazakii]
MSVDRGTLLGLFISGSAIMLLGIGLNVAILIELKTVKLQSRLTPWLLRSQVVFDGLACSLTILILWVQKIPTNDEVSGAIVCYLWDSQSSFWTAIALSTCNLMCITFDHLLATVHCVTYRIYQTRYIVACCIATFIYTLLVALPISLVVYYTNGTCQTEVRPEYVVAFYTAKIHQSLWAVVYYLLPLTFLITVHFRVACHIKANFRLRHTFTAPVAELSSATGQESNCGSVNDIGDAQSRSVIKSLTVGTFCLITSMILAHSYDSFYYVFGPSLGYAYIVGSAEQLISLLITAINCAVNPVILALSLPSMRKKIFHHMRMIKQHLGQFCHSCPSVRMKPNIH